jgi:hypothetical protein
MTMNRDWSKLGWAVVWIGWACLAVYRGFEHRREIRQFQASAETTEGVVTSAFPGFKSRDEAEPPEIEYEFEVNGRTYTGSSELYIPEGDPVEVRYSPSNPNENLAVGHRDGFANYMLLAVFMGGFGVWLAMVGYSPETAKRVNTTLDPSPFLRFPTVILCAASAYMLYNAAFETQPYAYYQILRWLVCGTAAMLAYYSYQWQNPWAPWLFGALAVLFNPFAPIHFERGVWSVIDRIAALIMVVAAFIVKPPELAPEVEDLA